MMEGCHLFESPWNEDLMPFLDPTVPARQNPQRIRWISEKTEKKVVVFFCEKKSCKVLYAFFFVCVCVLLVFFGGWVCCWFITVASL